MKIGFITCAADKLTPYFPTLAEPDFIQTDPLITPDDQIALNALRNNGFTIVPIIWGCQLKELKDFNLLIVRSPWDYMDSDTSKEHFMQWVAQLENFGIPVANPAPFMQWLLDKHYLRDLAAQNVAVIPTTYFEKNSQLNLAETFRKKGPFVLKQCVSAAGIGLFFIASLADANRLQQEFNQQLQQSSYMLQDFIPEITTNGEWSLVFLGGEYSHAVHKKPGENSILVHAERGGSLNFKDQPPQHIIDFAKQVYHSVLPAFTQATGNSCKSELILYLRIDVIDTKTGPVVIECEGVEPELFFRAQIGSEKKFTSAVKEILKM